MFEKDLLKDGPTSHLFQCGWYLDYPKDNTLTLGVPLRESIKSSFMETLASSTRTQVKGGRRKNASKGKGKLKEKVTKPPSSNVNQDAFVVVPLNQTVGLHTIKDTKREKRVLTHQFFPPLFLVEYGAFNRDHSNFLHLAQV
jgi:hypothetical protein